MEALKEMRNALLCLATVFIASVAVGEVVIPSNNIEMFVYKELVFFVQPVDRTGVLGNVASFVAEAVGQDVISYQWQKSTDGVTWADIPGKTTQVLMFPSVQLADEGDYRCVATDTWLLGSQTKASNVVALTVLPSAPPSAEMRLSYTSGNGFVGMVFNSRTNLIQGVLKSPGSLPAGSTFSSVTAVIMEFKTGAVSRFVEIMTVGGLPENGDSGVFVFDGSTAVDGDGLPSPIALAGWQGDVRLFFKVTGAVLNLAIDPVKVDGTLNAGALTVSGNYWVCPQLL